nr:ABC transporter ATP-binding protein [Maliibacterium massiliense]
MKRIFKELSRFKLELLLVILSVFGTVYGNLSLPNYLSRIINEGIARQDTALILNTGLIMLGFTLLAMVCNVLTGLFASRIAMGLGRNVRSQVFAKVQHFSQEEFDHFSTASLITRTNNDILQTQNFMVMFLRIILMAPIMCIGGVAMAYAKSPTMSMVLLVSIPLLIVLVVLIARRALPLSRAMQKKVDRINLVLREKLTGIRVIRAFGTEKHEDERFAQANDDLMRNAMKMQRTMALLMPALLLVLNGTVVFLLWFGGQGVPSGATRTGDIIAVIQYVMQIMMSVAMLSMVFVMYPRAAASAERIGEVMDTQPSITDPPQPKDNPAVRGHLAFQDVTFTFPGSDEPALRHISFEARPGETTAIIGSTGAGKSALVNLIPRFYDVQQGAVLIDGVNVKDYDHAVLRRKIGYVPQKALLFNGDVRENIRFGDAEADDARVEEAARIAQAYDFVAAKKSGFDSHIAQGGGNVSGGQRQRLAIARAIVRRPEIYIFDDSFSALDFKTDAALREALAAETSQATVLIVAQRVSTIMNAQRIIVLDDGEMVGMGTHRELLNTCETYREIVQSQLSEEEMAL